MKGSYYYYRSCGGPISPLAIIGGLILLIAAFFVALPLFLAALTAFGAAAAYLSWRINKAVKKAEEALLKQERDHGSYNRLEHTGFVIDITPEQDD